MELIFLCSTLVLILANPLSAFAYIYRGVHDTREDNFVEHIVRSTEADGHDLAIFYGRGLESDTNRILTKRDVEIYAVHPSKDSRSVILQFASGKQVSMSLKKRSVLTASTTVVEHFRDRREIIQTQPRNCFFSGPVIDPDGGHASFSFCDGRLMGSIHTPQLHYQIHPLPEPQFTEQRRSVTDLHLLVTWNNVTPGLQRRASNDSQASTDGDELVVPPPEEIGSTVPSTSVQTRRAAAEVGVYLNQAYLAKVYENLRLNTTQELIDLIVMKWCGVAAVYSDEEKVGWDLTIKLKHIEIWRQDPAWFASDGRAIGDHMRSICEGTSKPDVTLDHISLETAGTGESLMGLSWVSGVCRPHYRCSAVKGAQLGHYYEAHEFGHSMGLQHDADMHCGDAPHGVMGGNAVHLKDCYRTKFNQVWPGKPCLFRDDVPASVYSEQHAIFPEYHGQWMDFDRQCRVTNGNEFEYIHFPNIKLCEQFHCLANDVNKGNYGHLVVKGAQLGTACGDKLLCHGSSCEPWNVTTLDVDYLSQHIVRGGWGAWSVVSSCSGSCDDVVRIFKRTCNSPVPALSPYCMGDMYKGVLCPSKQTCLNESVKEADVVAQKANNLCSRHKGHNSLLTGNGSIVRTQGVVDKCTVRCSHVSGGHFDRYLLDDGSPCSGQDTDQVDSARRGISWRCVKGQCKAFGCDGVTLGDGGGKELDECGLCGGDGVSCKQQIVGRDVMTAEGW